MNSAKLPFIWSAPTKTDKEDAIKLAHLVEERRDEKLPIVPLPSEVELERRELISNYSREMKGRTQVINTLHSLFVKQGITTVVRKNLSTVEKARETIGLLKGQLREDAEYQVLHFELYEKRIKELKDKINQEAKADEDMQQLQTIAGVGPIIAFAFLAYVGNGHRFNTGSQVSNYLGFVPKLDYSGTIQRHGHITKRGNGYLRGLLIQAAWCMVRSKSGGALKERYIYATNVQGKSKKKTIVGIGRRMSELMYSVLRNKNAYEARPWRGGTNNPAALAKQAMLA